MIPTVLQIERVARTFEVDPREVLSPSRKHRALLARRVIYWLLRRREWTYEEIGELFGRDNSTIRWQIKTLTEILRYDTRLRAIVTQLISELE